MSGIHKELTEQIIGAAIEVHRHLGPGLLESAYEECLCHEMELRKMPYQRQVSLPLSYKGKRFDWGYRLDIVVAHCVVLELKSVEAIQPVHRAQLLTYVRLSGSRVGLLINFFVPVLHEGIVRISL